MFKKNLIFILLLLSVSLTAQAGFANPYSAACSLSYSSDSYGRGIEAVFLNRDVRPVLNDETCYQLGSQWAARTRAQANDEAGCLSDFSAGSLQGVQNSSISTGSPCYVLGFEAGRADLDVAAREGDVSVAGSECVRAYAQGRRAFKEGLVSDPSDFDALKAQYCYGLGWFEGTFNNALHLP